MTDIQILYEDKDMVAVNKPAGLVVHADGRTKESNLTDWILEKYPNLKEVGEPLRLRSGQANEEIIYRPGIVHRLDRDTSGVLVIAKNQKAFENLKQQFQERTTRKTYRAFVYGEIKESEGVVDRPIARSRKDFRLWSAQRGARGEAREAVTAYQVLARTKDFSYINVEPKTGRTHQIRVHMKAINHPVVCDPLYAPKREPALGFARLALHALSIEIASVKGKKILIEALLPADFLKAEKLMKVA